MFKLTPDILLKIQRNATDLIRIIGMKHQRPNLDTFPSFLPLIFFIDKRAMRHPSRPPISLTIKTLNQHDLTRCLPKQIMPLVAPGPLLTGPHSIRLACPVRINQFDRHEFVIRDGMGGRDTERVFEDRLDGPPDVDDLKTSF